MFDEEGRRLPCPHCGNIECGYYDKEWELRCCSTDKIISDEMLNMQEVLHGERPQHSKWWLTE